MAEPLFDANVIADMRALNEANLDLLASAWSYSSEDAGNRSMRKVENEEFVDVPCRLAPNNTIPLESLEGNAAISENRWRIIFAAGRNVGYGWKIVVSGVGFSREFRVTGMQGPRSNEIERVVIGEEVFSA